MIQSPKAVVRARVKAVRSAWLWRQERRNYRRVAVGTSRDIAADMPQIVAMTEWLGAIEQRVGPRISIVTATRNRPEMLADLGNAVSKLMYQNWEWVVVNDGDEGGLVDDVVAAAGSRARLLRSPGKGLVDARNAGLMAATGSYIVYADDDNVIGKNWLDAIAVVARNQPFVWGYGARVVETPEIPIWSHAQIAAPAIEYPRFNSARLKVANFIDANCLVHCNDGRRFDARTGSMSDWKFALQLAEMTPPQRIPVVASYYRTQHENRMSRSEIGLNDLAFIRDSKWSLRGLG